MYDNEPGKDEWKPEDVQWLLGVKSSLWTECCTTPEYVEYMIFPRLLALADVAWVDKGKKDWGGFLKRMDSVLPHIKGLGITCAESMYNIDHKVSPAEGALTIELSCIRPDVAIRYTSDGTEPTGQSPLYDTPITVQTGSYNHLTLPTIRRA